MRWTSLGLVAVVALGGCARGDGEGRNAAKLAPRFAPEGQGGDVASSSTTTTSTATSAEAGGTTSTTRRGTGARRATTTTTAAPARVTSAAITDRLGDLTPSPVDRPPVWADLAGATLLRRDSGYELRVRLGGDTAPQTVDADHTMNIATFFDVNGDGRIDYEVWANLASGGWGGSYFDNVRGGGKFLDASGVAVAVEGAEVVLRFPLGHLEAAERFRFALASEWGRYEVLGTAAMARDDVPDNDAAARFPA